jgi:hypothetical protein
MQMYCQVSGDGDPLVVLDGAYTNIPSMERSIAQMVCKRVLWFEVDRKEPLLLRSIDTLCQ